MKLVTVFEGPEITKYLCPTVVVEMWRSVMTTGMGKRKFLKAFTTEEQAIIKKMHKTYCHWCLGVSGTGIPNKHTMKIKEFQLMHRAAKFFGEF
jgi:hypothetical protein